MSIRRSGFLRQVRYLYQLHTGIGEQFIAVAICDEEAGLSPGYHNPTNSRVKNELRTGTRP
jgi:hypothetical protein